MTESIWNQVKQELSTIIGQNNHTSWIEPLSLTSLENGIALFEAPTAFIGKYVNQNFSDQIRRQFNKSGEAVRKLEFSVPKDTTRKQRKNKDSRLERPGRADRHSDSQTSRQIGTAPLDPRFTFETFVVGKPNELAHAAAQNVAFGGQHTFNPLFLYGGVGLGKTHLMHAIAWQLCARNSKLNVLYLSAEQFMYRFVQALREQKMMDFKHLFRSVDVLMVDDVQFIAGKDSTQDEFFHTFNALVEQNKQIIISGDRSPDDMKELENRIRSRLQCGLVVDLHPTDYELRLGILHSKVAQHQESAFSSQEISNDVLEFLAHRISTNVRALEGALTRLFACSSLVGRPIDMDLTQECLSDVLRSSERKISIEEIQRKVSDYYNIKISEMVGPKRMRSYARPRQIAMFLAKNLTSRSLPEIGRCFGGRDHTTVMHGVRRVEELRNNDGQVAEDLEMLRRILEG